MENAVNRDYVGLGFVEDRVRKASNERSAVILMYFRVKLGHAANSFDAGIDTTEEVLS
jgi:hypothetical protein